MCARASILVGLLWCLALLSVVVIGVLHTARMDLLVVKNYGDRIQAHYLALAGIEKAEALLYRDAHDRSGRRQNHSGELYNAPQQFRNVVFGRGQFRVFRRGRQDEGGGLIYGVSDEESRLNVNTASADELAKLDGITPDIATAIIGWRGGSDVPTTAKAEADYYLSLQPPYLPRNGPFQTIRELLMVRGISPALLLGKDIHQNGLLPSAEDEAGDSASASLASDVDTGWAGIMTVDSSVKNLNAAGEDRVNVQTADEASLTSVRGITPEIARAIVAYRGQHQFQTIADLLDVPAAQNQNQNQRSPGMGEAGQPSSDQSQSTNTTAAASGPKVISENLLMDVADDVTVSSDKDLPGVINLNTASLDVLACLPGVDRELAQAIISFRQSNGFYPNVAWLLKVDGMTRDIFKQVVPLVSARSETFRILSEGQITSTGARQRILETVHVDLNGLKTLSYREDDL